MYTYYDCNTWLLLYGMRHSSRIIVQVDNMTFKKVLVYLSVKNLYLHLLGTGWATIPSIESSHNPTDSHHI